LLKGKRHDDDGVVEFGKQRAEGFIGEMYEDGHVSFSVGFSNFNLGLTASLAILWIYEFLNFHKR
jgi:hypothetical protein